MYWWYRGYEWNVSLWVRKATWRKSRDGRPWSWCVCWFGSPRSLVVMLTACLFITTLLTASLAVFLNADRVDHDYFVMFFLWQQRLSLISSFYIIFYIFLEGICFVSWMWYSEQLCRGQILFSFAFLAFTSCQRVEWVNRKEI